MKDLKHVDVVELVKCIGSLQSSQNIGTEILVASVVLRNLPMYVDLEDSKNFSAEVSNSKNFNTTSLINVGTKDSRKRWY